MKPITLFIAALLLAVGGILGWFLGPSHHGQSKNEAPTPAKSSRTLTDSSRPSARIPDDARMRAIHDSKNESERMRAALELAKTLPLDQAEKWLDQGLFTQREGFALTLFTKTLRKRWQTADPDGFLVWQLENGESISKEEMARFAGSNPDQLLVKIRNLDDAKTQGQALENLAKTRPDLVFAELAKMDIQQLLRSGGSRGIFEVLAKSDLAGLQSVLDELPFKLQSSAERVIYKQLFSENYTETLRQVVDLPNGLSLIASPQTPEDRQALWESFSSLPEKWQNSLTSNSSHLTNGMKPLEIFSTDWESYGLSEKQSEALRGQILFSAARNNKEGALELFQNANLDEAGRRHFLDMLSWNRGEKIIEELLPHLESADGEYITKKMEQRNASSSFGMRNIKTAADLSEKFTKPDPQRDAYKGSPMQNWTTEQKAQFQTDYAAMQGEERHRVTAMVLRTKDLNLRAAAVSELLANPDAQEVAGWIEKKENATVTTSKVAIALLKQDSDRATTWITNLPESDTRTWAMKNLAANWKNYDPVEAEKWVDTLPATEREAVSSFLDKPGN